MKNLAFIILFVTFWLLVFGNLSYAGDYTLNVTDRSKGKSVTCVFQKVGGNRVVICSERDFVLSEPFPTNKTISLPINKAVSIPINKAFSNPSTIFPPVKKESVVPKKPSTSNSNRARNPFEDIIRRSRERKQ